MGSSNKKIAVVTGASTGIGYQLCKDLLKVNWLVYGSVRNQEDGKRLTAELPGIQILEFDVTDHLAIDRAAQELQSLQPDGIDYLVNNAGIVVSGPLLHVSMDDLTYQLQVNVVGVMKVTQAFAPLLGAQKDYQGTPGKIMQISSVSGKMGMPFVGPYAASKHALEGLSESLRRELLLYGIDVIVIGPGAVKTPIWNKNTNENEKYLGTDYGSVLKDFQTKLIRPIMEAAIPVEELSRSLVKIMGKSNPRPRYTFTNNIWKGYYLPLLLPIRWVDRAIKKQLGL